MTNKINIFFNKIKRDVTLSRQYMFVLKKYKLRDLFNLNDKIAIK